MHGPRKSGGEEGLLGFWANAFDGGKWGCGKGITF
jgi:hypothetical protein